MKKYHILIIALFIVSFFIGCAALQTKMSIPKTHPEKLTQKPICSDCHDEKNNVGVKPFSYYNHNASFFDEHGSVASSSSAVCESCHKEKFCSDCHGNKEEIVPSRKLGNQPDITSPHRGDYFTKHKIDGRLNKSECFACHGRRNNSSCDRCH